MVDFEYSAWIVYSGAGKIWKWGGHRSRAKMGGTDTQSAGKKILSCPSTFLALNAHFVVLVSAFVMVSTVWWSVYCLLLLTVPRALPFVKVGARAPRAPWSRRHWLCSLWAIDFDFNFSVNLSREFRNIYSGFRGFFSDFDVYLGNTGSQSRFELLKNSTSFQPWLRIGPFHSSFAFFPPRELACVTPCSRAFSTPLIPCDVVLFHFYSTVMHCFLTQLFIVFCVL